MAIGTEEREMIQAEAAAVREQFESWGDRKLIPINEELQRVKGGLEKVLALQKDARRAELMRSRDGAGVVPDGKYRGMRLIDLQLVRSLLNAQVKADQGYDGRVLHDWGERLDMAWEALDSTTAGTGDELVPTLEGSELWDDVNLETAVLPLFSSVTMPSNPFDIPLQFGDVNWFPGVENLATKGTNLATAKQTLTAYEIVAEVLWSLTLDEDSVIAMAEEVRSGVIRNSAEVIDDVLVNADTSTLNNINADGTTIATGDAGKGQWLLGFDGLIHLPLIDNTGQRNDHGASPTDDMWNEIRAKLGKYGVRPSGLAFLTDINTFIRSQVISNMRTLDKFGPEATILTGQLGAVEGIPVIVSEQMLLAAADGLVTDGVAGTTGRLLLVNRGQWRTGFRRQLTVETTRDIQKRQNIMVLSLRLAFMERTGNRGTATHTALQFNITGVT